MLSFILFWSLKTLKALIFVNWIPWLFISDAIQPHTPVARELPIKWRKFYHCLYEHHLYFFSNTAGRQNSESIQLIHIHSFSKMLNYNNFGVFYVIKFNKYFANSMISEVVQLQYFFKAEPEVDFSLLNTCLCYYFLEVSFSLRRCSFFSSKRCIVFRSNILALMDSCV